MLVVADLANTKSCKKPEKMNGTLSNGYSTESTIKQELSNECQHYRVYVFFKNLCLFVLLTKIAVQHWKG